ncbi:AsmA family protein [Desulfolutivibrio sulfoxidireducens]|uniref:AsmA family protein n=1 Tax=Desulfolutivibrio sulfoxidireducens TaxID=2773299 RepID=UPI00159D1AD9|nr:AsmA family protein [Desulfolutivibrio sulfoxidireducens]QLA20410.1 AsmA family protein [Desulfolutivibrio sulfoxidireducens]
MTPTRKKLLVVLLGLAALAVTGLLVLRLLVDPAAFTPLLTGFVKQTTGLSLTIDGGLRLSLFPSLGITMRRASLGDLPGFPGESFADIEEASIQVRPMALLRGDLEVLGLSVRGLRVRLVRDKDGRENWKALPIAKVEVKKDAMVVTKNDGQTTSFRYLVKTARLSGSEVVFENRADGTVFSLTDIDFSADGIEPGRPFAAEMSLSAASVRPEIQARVDLSGKTLVDPAAMRFAVSDATVGIKAAAKGLPVAAFQAQGHGDLELLAEENRITGRKMTLSGSASGGSLPGDGLAAGLELSFDYDYGTGLASCPALVLTVPKAGLTAKGTFEASGLGTTPRATLTLAAAPFDAKALLAMSGVPLPAMREKNALGKVGFSLNAAYLENKETRLETDLSLDGAPIRVTAQAATGDRTRIAAGVDIQTLDLTGYLPAASASPPKDAAQRKKGTAVPGQNLVLDLRLSAKRLDVDKLSLTGVELVGTLDNGVAQLSRLRAGLFGGSITATGRADPRQPATAVAVRAEGSGLQAGPLLLALTGKEPLTGTAGFRADLAATGNDQAAVMRSLSGTASMSLKNGRIAGLSLSQDILSAPQRLLSLGLGGDDATKQGSPEGTAVTSAGFSAAIKNGVATTRDILVQAPPHKVTGQGSVTLPTQTLDLRLTAHVAGVADIPVVVAGTFSEPTVTPDMTAIPAAAIGGAAGKAVKVLTDPGGAAKDVLDAVNPLNLLPFGRDTKK